MATSVNPVASMPLIAFEVIDSEELARRWAVPESWVREQVRTRATDPIPHLRFGKYVRFQWGSPVLDEWIARRMMTTNRKSSRDLSKEIQ